MKSVCKVNECRTSTAALGMCDKHYRSFKKYGHTENTKIINLVCSWCKKPFKITIPLHHTNYPKCCSNSCKSQMFSNKSPLCEFEECKKKSKQLNGGYCDIHYTRFRLHGDPKIVKKLAKYPEGARCKIDVCKNKVLAQNMCNKHYTMWRIHGNPKGGRYEYKIRKAVTYDDKTRTCSECEKRLPIRDFHKDKGATDGFRSKCKKCRLGLVKKWYLIDVIKRRQVATDARKKDPEKFRKKDLERYEKHREKRIAIAIEHSHLRKARKKKTKSERGISKLALKGRFGTKCYYCRKEMDFSVGVARKFNRNMATIEHLVPLARGGEHTFKNTVLACRHCNISKNSKSELEFKKYNKK